MYICSWNTHIDLMVILYIKQLFEHWDGISDNGFCVTHEIFCYTDLRYGKNSYSFSICHWLAAGGILAYPTIWLAVESEGFNPHEWFLNSLIVSYNGRIHPVSYYCYIDFAINNCMIINNMKPPAQPALLLALSCHVNFTVFTYYKKNNKQ